ncbi:hypothetical protein [Leptospira bandrabouensis]|uniref:Uncharacterized protein n=1 Tax=Leptospira bandrabouensis TaxID=2484903 RepID=A0A6H3NQX5_9LEPT|nr:hypothetical protein [Leptospira bandrabouensis]TGN09980.1 hypothetical protein EHR07_00440 [Leptospira bandrabouensis]TGN12362.1 hypothetical protein EHR08_13350 [Leptospira bandrabouensis]
MEIFNGIELKDWFALFNLLTPIFFWVAKRYIQDVVTEVKKDIEKAIEDLEEKLSEDQIKINDKVNEIERRVLIIETNYTNKNESIERIETNIEKLFDKIEELKNEIYRNNR